ncbi:recombinase family protein [Bradyrhizobium icense]|uniref:recombinase family protein n=1 Tax=Bradyrhizobium icense TaxID=1274631 RepID=UPI0018D30EC4|nr:recombinase family protein [Bradyrhizobium icense]
MKWIFRRFVDVKSEKAVARELNRHSIPPCSGERWTGPKITRILRNENYIGNIIYNRLSSKLGTKRVKNSSDKWVRSEGCIEPIVSVDDFLAARKIIAERRVDGLTEGEMLARLRRTLKKEGRLTPTIISKTVDLPSHHVYRAHFGTMRNAYRLVGYLPERNFEYMDSRCMWLHRLSELQSQVATQIKKAGGQVVLNGLADGLRVNGMVNIYFRIAQIEHPARDHYAPRWFIQRRNLPDGWIVAMRLADRSKTLLDYLLVPTIRTDRNTIRFSEKLRTRFRIVSFKTPGALVRSLNRRLASLNPAAPTKLGPPKTPRRTGHPKRSTGRARR